MSELKTLKDFGTSYFEGINRIAIPIKAKGTVFPPTLKISTKLLLKGTQEFKEYVEKNEERQYNEKSLRQEAIKWVKEWNIYDKDIVIKEGDYGSAGLSGASGAFIKFFNITEEDLK